MITKERLKIAEKAAHGFPKGHGSDWNVIDAKNPSIVHLCPSAALADGLELEHAKKGMKEIISLGVWKDEAVFCEELDTNPKSVANKIREYRKSKAYKKLLKEASKPIPAGV